MKLINNIFSIGYRCNTDEFLINFLKIRKYSSVFSYLVIYFETSIDFINNNFKNFIKSENIINEKKKLKFNKKDWTIHSYHKFCKNELNQKNDVLDVEKLCLFRHHDLENINIIKSFYRRIKHILICLKTKKVDTTLLFYIEKIQNFEGIDQSYFDLKKVNKIKYNILIIIPLLNFNSKPYLYYNTDNIKIIYFNSTTVGWTVDMAFNKSEPNFNDWNNLCTLIKKLYKFDIKERNIKI